MLTLALVLLCQVAGSSDEGQRTVTFLTEDAFLETLGLEGSHGLNLSLEVRTFQQTGLLLFHQLSSQGHVQLSLSEGKLRAEVVVEGTAPRVLEHPATRLDDGEWHTVQFWVGRGKAVLVVGEARVGGRVGKVTTGSLYRVGGGLHGEQGLVGCLR